MKPLLDIATRLEAIAKELDAGHLIDPDDIRLEARRIRMQAEMGNSAYLTKGQIRFISDSTSGRIASGILPSAVRLFSTVPIPQICLAASCT